MENLKQKTGTTLLKRWAEFQSKGKEEERKGRRRKVEKKDNRQSKKQHQEGRNGSQHLSCQETKQDKVQVAQ